MFGELGHKTRTTTPVQVLSYLNQNYVTGVGAYYWMHPYITAVATGKAIDTFGQIAALPWIVPNTITLTQIGIDVTVGGDTGSVLRFGIYMDNGQATPGVLIRDLGTIDGTNISVTNPTFTPAFSLTLQPGLYWVAMAPQNNTTPGTNRPTTGTIALVNTPFSLGTAFNLAIPVIGGQARSWHAWTPSTSPAFTLVSTTFNTPGNWGGGVSTSGNAFPRFAIRIL